MGYKERAAAAVKSNTARSLMTEIVILSKSGDVLVGLYKGSKTIRTKTAQKHSTLYIFDTDDGRKGLLVGAYAAIVLDDEDNVGKVLQITRGEKITPADGNEYVEYTVLEV